MVDLNCYAIMLRSHLGAMNHMVKLVKFLNLPWHFGCINE